MKDNYQYKFNNKKVPGKSPLNGSGSGSFDSGIANPDAVKMHEMQMLYSLFPKGSRMREVVKDKLGPTEFLH